MALHRERQAEGVLGDAAGVGAAGREHDGAGVVGGVEVDVVEADAGAGDDPQRGVGLEQLAGDPGAVADHECGGPGQPVVAGRRGLRGVEPDDVVHPRQLLERGAPHALGDDDAGRGGRCRSVDGVHVVSVLGESSSVI